MTNGNLFPIGSIAFQGEQGNLYSEIIKGVTKSKFSHTFIVLESVHGRQAILEAGARETIINFTSQYSKPKDYYEVYTPLDTSRVEETIENCLKKYLHIEYSYAQALGVGLVTLNRSLGITINNPFDKGIICSELSYYYIQQLLNVESLHGLSTPNNVSPEDVHAWVKASPLFKLTWSKQMDSLPQPVFD